MNAYMKSGFRNNGTRPDKDTRKIWDTRKPHDNLKDIGGVLKWLDTGLKGASDLTGNLFHVPLPFLKGNNLYIKKGEKAPSKFDIWQQIRHKAGYFGPTHYLASLAQVIGQTVVGGTELGGEAINVLAQYIGEGIEEISGTEGSYDSAQKDKFEKWLGNSWHYHFVQRPLATDITDLIYINDREKTLEILQKHNVIPSHLSKEIQEDADKEEAWHKKRGTQFDKEDYIKRETDNKLSRSQMISTNFRMHGQIKGSFEYTEADVAILFDKLREDYKKIALPKKETAQARQMADGVLGDYTDPERLKAAIRKDPMNFVVDGLDIVWGTKGLTKSVGAGGRINKALRLQKIKDWAAKKRAQTQATKPGMPYEPPKTEVPPADAPDLPADTDLPTPDTTTDIPDDIPTDIPSDTPGDGAERIKTEIGDKDSPSLVDDTTESPLSRIRAG